MAEMNLSRENYVDYVGSYYFKALNVQGDLVYEPDVVKVGDEEVVIIRIHGADDDKGVQTTTGAKVDITFWPRNHATEDDLATIKKIKAANEPIVNCVFRIGYRVGLDENGDQTILQGSPKWLSLKTMSGKTIKLSGEKRDFNE